MALGSAVLIIKPNKTKQNKQNKTKNKTKQNKTKTKNKTKQNKTKHWLESNSDRFDMSIMNREFKSSYCQHGSGNVTVYVCTIHQQSYISRD